MVTACARPRWGRYSTSVRLDKKWEVWRLPLSACLARAAPCSSSSKEKKQHEVQSQRDAAANAGWASLLHSRATGPARLRSPLGDCHITDTP